MTTLDATHTVPTGTSLRPGPPGAAPTGAARSAQRSAVPASGAVAATTHPDPEAGLARAYAVGSIAGFVGVGAVCGGIALLGGVEPGAALGAAAFAGFWGGPGFGGTLAGVLHLERRHPND